jgi:hypothetical protein
MRRFGLLMVAGLAVLLSACASVQPQDYAAEKPALDLPTYFNGTLDGWGMVKNRSGKVTRRFHVVIDARWNGDIGVLDEDFTWNDGKKERRIWTLKRQPDGTWRGTADDVKGEAVGIVAGNALNWRYVLKLPVDGKVYEVNFDDWMFQMDERVMLNHAVMSKFGIRLAEIYITFRKR